jgi:hypothetical protein
LSFFLLVICTVLLPFQAILKTTTLDVRQWLICTGAALSIIVAAEIRKAVRRRTGPASRAAATGPTPSSPGTSASQGPPVMF